jgi:hypothetical protein
MIINNLIHLDKITIPISKEVSFAIAEGNYQNLYSQAFPQGLSPVDEKFTIKMVQLTQLELDELEDLLLLQVTDTFIGYQPINEAAIRPFYAPDSWTLEKIVQYRGVQTETLYNVEFTITGYYNV